MRNMKWLKPTLLLMIVLACLPLSTVVADDSGLRLTQEERSWLAAHPKIIVGGEMDWAPFDFVDKSGTYNGIASDYLKVIEEKLGIEVEIITGPSWDELLTMIRQRKIDVLPAIYHSKGREAFVNFTAPYLKLTEFIFSRSGDESITGFRDLGKKTLVVVKGYTIEDYLISNYPEIDLITAPTIHAALKKLITREADAFIGDIISTTYNIYELSLMGIQPVAAVPFKAPEVCMAVRKDWSVLRSLLDKVLYSMSEGERNAIKTHWVSLAEAKIEQKEPDINLKPQEQAWLGDHPEIRVHNETNSPPFNFSEHGLPKGFSIEYMRLLAEKIGVKVKFVTGPSWDEFQEMVKSGDLDVMLNIAKTPERKHYLSFTPSYLTLSQTLYTRKDAPHVISIEDLYGKRIAVPKGFYIAEMLRAYPQIEVLEVRDIVESMHAVSVGKAEALYDVMPVVNYLMKKHQITNLKLGGDLGIEAGRPMPLHLAVSQENAVLAEILSKGMALITDEEYQTLSDKWLGRVTDKKDRIPLTDSEREWLDSHRDIRLGVDPNWPPYDYIDMSGNHGGLAADVLKLLSERLGIDIRLVSGLDWSQVLDAAQKHDLDIISLLKPTTERAKYLNFTGPIVSTPYVIVTSKNFRPVSNLGDMVENSIAMVKDYAIVELSREAYPALKIRTFESGLAALQAVSSGKVDAYVGYLGTVSYQIQQKGLVNLKIAAEAGVKSPPLAIGVRSDWPELIGILNKGLASISREEMNAIQQKWIPVEVGVASQAAAPVSYKQLLVYGIAVLIIVCLLAFILIKVLKRENVAVSFGSHWFRGLVLAGLSTFVLIVGFLGWYNLELNKRQILQDVDENLKGILSVSVDRLNLWLQERTSYTARLGRDPKLVAITKRLLQVEPKNETLIASDALREARNFFENTEDIFANIGFFIISPDQVSIGSRRDANLGTSNFIARRHPKLLHRAFKGEVGFVPPMESDVHLGNAPQSDKGKKPPTMFFIGPIKDTDGRVLAVMTLRVDPWQDFSRTLSISWGQRTGEAYVFDRNGTLLSPSRFEDQLHRIGLLDENQRSALNIELRDPGINMVKGQRPGKERSRQPLTHMAASALALQQQMEMTGIRQRNSKIESSLDGYRDYRGVPVYGVWIWNAALDMGLAVEVDVDAALSHYYETRLMILGILGFTLLLSVGAVLSVLIIGERTSRDLVKARDNLEKEVADRTAELRDNQERFRSILTSADEGIFGVDLDGKAIFVNPATTRLLGYEPAELIGQEIHQILHHSYPDGSPYPAGTCPMFMAYTKGTTQTVSDEMLWHKDGIGILVEYSANPIVQGDQISGAVITFRDITERKRAEQEIRNTQKRLVQIIDSLPDPTFVIDNQDVVIAWNRAMAEMTKISAEDMIGKGNYEYALPFYGERRPLLINLVKDWDASLAEAHASVSEKEDGVLVAESYHPDLHNGTYLAGTAKALYDIDGKPAGAIESVRDVTETQEIQEALQESESRVKTILDSVNTGILVINPEDRTIIDVNPVAADMIGLPAEKIIGRVCHQFICPRANLDCPILDHNQEVDNAERVLLTAEGLEIPILKTVVSVELNGKEHLLESFVDISERKAAEEELQQNLAELERFNKLTINREERMIALKEEVNAILKQLGKPGKYKIIE